MKLIFRTYYLILLLPLLNGCVEPANLELDEPSKIVLLSQQFYPGEPMQVLLAQTQPLFTGGNYYVNNATVTLFKNGILEGKLNYETDSDGLYGFNDNIIPEEGAAYRITVEAPNLNAVRAENPIPNPVRIRALEIPDFEETPNGENELEINFKINVVIDDPFDEDNYYHLNFYQWVHEYFVIGRDTIVFPIATLVNPNVQSSNVSEPIRNHPEGGGMIRDELFNGQLKSFEFDGSLTINKDINLLGDLVVELRTITEEYYQFYTSLERQSQSSSNFNITAFDDPTSVFTNVENGYGIFAGFSFAVETIKVK